MARVRDDVPPVAKPPSDAYTGLLAISLGAMITGCAFLYMDYSQYPEKAPQKAPAPVSTKSIESETPATATPAPAQ